MRELLIVRRNCAVWEDGFGRRDYRPGAIISVEESWARKLLESGSAERLVQPAPLFDATATEQVAVPKRRARPNG
jgi:hypothetical protein